MAKPKKKALKQMANKGLQALQTLSVQFVSHLIEEGAKGEALDKIVSSFTRNQAKIVSSILGGAGLSGPVPWGFGVVSAMLSDWSRCQSGYLS